MEWLHHSGSEPPSVASSLLVLALVIATGLMIGRLRIAGVRLGAAGVLFSGMIFGHFGWSLLPELLEFTGDFGLILFVFAIGLTIGPGFFNALRAHGLTLNLLAASVVLLGVLLTVTINRVAGIEMPIAVGIFTGSTTNTPSLAAATQTLRDHPPQPDTSRRALAQAGVDVGDGDAIAVAEVAKLPGLGYAIAYPFGVIGIILSMVLMRILFRVDPIGEAKSLDESLQSKRPRLERLNLRVTNPNLNGLTLGQIPGLAGANGSHIVVSRMLRDDVVTVPQRSTEIRLGDVLLAVGTREQLEQLRIVVGEPSPIDLMEIRGEISFHWVVVTRAELVGKSLDELHLDDRFGVQVTRVRRSEIEMPPLAKLRLAMGDQLLVVGRRDAVNAVAKKVGDLPKELERSDLTPMFAGIALGVVVGSIPIWFPGASAAVKLGLAGGPLLVAILLGSIARVGPFVFYLPRPASHILREMGIAIFLATVGLRSDARLGDSLP